MRILRMLFDFYLDASIHVAFAVLALYRITCLNFNIPETKNLDFVIFLSTLVMYNFIKYGSRAKKYIFVQVKYEKIIQVFSFAAGIILFFQLFSISVTNLFFLLLLAFLSLSYILPLMGSGINLRSFSRVKVYLVALVWALSTVILPFGDYLQMVNGDVFLSLVQRFLLVVVLILPFEIRDIQSDAIHLVTIPRKVGVPNTKKLGYMLLLVTIVLELFKLEIQPEKFISLLIFTVFTGLMLKFTKTEQSLYYTKFWVEGVPIILWGVSEILFGFL